MGCTIGQLQSSKEYLQIAKVGMVGYGMRTLNGSANEKAVKQQNENNLHWW